jgi:hypothetical protein
MAEAATKMMAAGIAFFWTTEVARHLCVNEYTP